MSTNHRPVNLDPSDILFRFTLPLTAWVSLTHRVTGMVLFAGMAGLIYALDLAVSSPEGLAELKALLAQPLGKVVAFVILAALAFHLVAGIKHLFMDFGIGEDLEVSQVTTKVAVAVSLILFVLAGVWLW